MAREHTVLMAHLGIGFSLCAIETLLRLALARIGRPPLALEGYFLVDHVHVNCRVNNSTPAKIESEVPSSFSGQVRPKECNPGTLAIFVIRPARRSSNIFTIPACAKS